MAAFVISTSEEDGIITLKVTGHEKNIANFERSLSMSFCKEMDSLEYHSKLISLMAEKIVKNVRLDAELFRLDMMYTPLPPPKNIEG